MIERFGVRGTEQDGVFFTEGSLADARCLGRIEVSINRQNADLGEVKRRMATDAKRLGATVITNFRYGQRKHRWWELFLLKWDTESWYGEGDAVEG